jgi:TRAP-type C4-dicarboxylate transport system substrate-binding protein
VLDGAFGQKLFDDMAEVSGLRVIGSYDNGGYRNFSNSVRKVKTAADMAGLKIRTMDIPVHMEIVKALGATPTPVAFLELYSALQTRWWTARRIRPSRCWARRWTKCKST